MKKTMIAALVVATAAAGFTVARADQGDDKGFGGRQGRRGPDQAQLLEKFDANHNGVLDPEEKEAARKGFRAGREQGREQRQAKLLEKFDTNHNGTIDPEERQAMQAQRETRRTEMLKKYDTDGDGKLSDSEREALRKDMREHHQERENR
jgi:Ca2+-binding EF-hand superfamily protein